MMARDNMLKKQLMLGTIAVTLLVGIGWCYERLSDARAAAASAANDLADCRALTGRIDALRRQAPMPGAPEQRAADLSHRIERAASRARFSEGSIQGIEPGPPRRVGESRYGEVSTQVRLQHVTLQQVFTFLHALAESEQQQQSEAAPASGLALRSIRLVAPRGEETGDRWMVESTLTYIVNAPSAAGVAADGEARADR